MKYSCACIRHYTPGTRFQNSELLTVLPWHSGVTVKQNASVQQIAHMHGCVQLSMSKIHLFFLLPEQLAAGSTDTQA